MRKALRDRNRREHHRHRTRQHHAALYGLDDLGRVAVARIVVAIGVGDADDRAVQRVVRIAHRLDEDLAQEQRKAGITIARQSLTQPVSHFICPFIALMTSFRGVQSTNPESRDSGSPLRSVRNDLILSFQIDDPAHVAVELHAAKRAALVEITYRIGLELGLFRKGVFAKILSPAGRTIAKIVGPVVVPP